MDFKIDRRTLLQAGCALAAAHGDSGLGAGQADAALLGGVLGQGHPRGHDQDVREGHRSGLHARGVPTAATCSSRAPSLSRCSATTSRWATSRRRTSRSRFRRWSILTSAYLFRDANHLNAFFASDLGAEWKKMAEDQLKVKILGPTFFGTRQVGLKPKKKINTPADMAGIKLRMPPGDAWQLLGRSIGANPTPMAYAETYTGLQTGAIDGQDNPLPNVQNMKFYEVMSQIVLTSHLVGFDLPHGEPARPGPACLRPSRRLSRPRPTRRSPGARRST